MSLIDLIYPKKCVKCGLGNEYICGDCRRELIVPEEICPVCTNPSLDGRTHSRCRTKDGMDGLTVGLAYKGLVQKCLKKVKYRSNWDIVAEIVDICKFPAINDFEITYVPMWPKKERERGFNQAQIVANLVSRGHEIMLLERSRETRPMFGLSKTERTENISKAFRFVGKTCPQKVMLVDDVWTTGATMRECAKVLKQNGALEVWGLTLAR